MIISANSKHYQNLNEDLRKAYAKHKKVTIKDVNGQRYIGCGLKGDYNLDIFGTPGNDLAAYMDGPVVRVSGNVQDAAGNTMGSGEITVCGSAGDAPGYAMRGGTMYIKSNVGYRCGIHMKEYKNSRPAIVIGGCAGSFLGEYMAGGIIIILGLDKPRDAEIAGYRFATGMHGGVIYLRGGIPKARISNEVMALACDEDDKKIISQYIDGYCSRFNYDRKDILNEEFVKIIPRSKRPYANMYAYV